MNLCVICNRELLDDHPSVDRHHFTPKSQGGKETTAIHKVCHSKIHSLFSNSDLDKLYDTAEKLLATDDMQNFVKWVSKKEPEFYERSKRSSSKYRRR